jgi:hypothetical protein
MSELPSFADLPRYRQIKLMSRHLNGAQEASSKRPAHPTSLRLIVFLGTLINQFDAPAWMLRKYRRVLAQAQRNVTETDREWGIRSQRRVQAMFDKWGRYMPHKKIGG